MRVRTPRVWSEVNNVAPGLVLIQKMWRGYRVRKWIREAGEGALCRRLCHNDEDVATLESKLTLSPLDFFSFRENDKLWWFDVHTIAKYASANLVPMNPYTREPLSIDTRRRLRAICLRRKLTYAASVPQLWLEVCQVLEENGFEKVNPVIFESLNRTQYTVFLNLMKGDIEAIVAESPNNADRKRALIIAKHILRKYTPFADQNTASKIVALFLVNALRRYSDAYPICFAIMGSFTRL